METTIAQNENDRILWKQAKKRISFKNSLAVYLSVNTLLWILWAIPGGEPKENEFPWQIFSTLGWGFGLLWQFMGVFIFDNKISRTEKEFQKLKKEPQFKD